MLGEDANVSFQTLAGASLVRLARHRMLDCTASTADVSKSLVERMAVVHCCTTQKPCGVDHLSAVGFPVKQFQLFNKHLENLEELLDTAQAGLVLGSVTTLEAPSYRSTTCCSDEISVNSVLEMSMAGHYAFLDPR